TSRVRQPGFEAHEPGATRATRLSTAHSELGTARFKQSAATTVPLSPPTVEADSNLRYKGATTVSLSPPTVEADRNLRHSGQQPPIQRSQSMANDIVTVVAKIRAARGKGDALAALLKEQAGVVRKNEPGCLVYRPHRSTKDPDLFLFYEQ